VSRTAVLVEGVTKDYPIRRGLGDWLRHPFRTDRIRALHDVTMRIAPGEIVALLGPNGSGKSTLLKILSSLVLPTAGRAEVLGIDVARRSIVARARIGYCMSEERSFYYRLTGRQNLRFFGQLLEVRLDSLDREIDEAASLLGLGEIDDRFMTYSTGTRQKLCAARALLGRRPVLLLDEPTRGLDPYTARRLLGRLRELARDEGRGILLASHDLGAIDRIADRLVFLHRGEVIADGTPDEVPRRFRIPRQVEIEIAPPVPAGWIDRLREIEGVQAVDSDNDEAERGRCRVQVAETFSIDQFLSEFQERCAAVRRFEVRRGSLEELYRKFAEESE